MSSLSRDIVLLMFLKTLFPGLNSSIEVHNGFAASQARFVLLSVMLRVDDDVHAMTGRRPTYSRPSSLPFRRTVPTL